MISNVNAITANGLISILLFPYKKKINCQQKDTTYYQSKVQSIFCIPFNHNLIFLTKTNAAIRKNKLINIAATASIIALKMLSCLIKNGLMTPAVNQAAAMVLRNSDKDLS